MKKIKQFLGATVATAALLLAGCGDKESAAGPLKLGMIPGPEWDVMEQVVDRLGQEGVQVELIAFQDYATPNRALADGSIDVNAFQHKPYLDAMVRDQGLKLAAVGNTFVYPMAVFSKKIESLAELKEGGRVAIPNDPSNEGRALILLHSAGLIGLADVANLEATPLDIVHNPKNLRFVELDASQLPRAMQDVDIAVINNTFAVPAGLTLEQALLVESKESPYMNIFAARADSLDDPRIIKLVQAYQTDETLKVAKKLFKGGAVKGW